MKPSPRCNGKTLPRGRRISTPRNAKFPKSKASWASNASPAGQVGNLVEDAPLEASAPRLGKVRIHLLEPGRDGELRVVDGVRREIGQLRFRFEQGTRRSGILSLGGRRVLLGFALLLAKAKASAQTAQRPGQARALRLLLLRRGCLPARSRSEER